MSAVWTVAAREIRARRMLLTASLVVAALPFVARVLGGPLGRDLQELTALFLCTSFPFAVALGVGASVVSRELAERRLGFYFSRPISSWALWAGKVLGGAAVILASFVLTQAAIQLTITVVPGTFDPRLTRVFSFVLLLLFLVMALAHVATSMYRARSGWLLLDFVMAAAAMAAVAAILHSAMEAGAFLDLRPWLPLVAAAAAAALFGAAGAQIAVGRTDARRAHRALSAVTWGSLLVILGVFGALARWVVSPPPSQTGGAGYPLVAAPAGDGLFFRGLAGRAGFRPYFLMAAGSGSFIRVSPEISLLPTFSADGKLAAWISIPEPWEEDHRPRLSVVRVGRTVELLARTPMDDGLRWHTVLAIHPDGRKAVVAGDLATAIVDLQTARVVGSVPLAQAMAADVLPDGRARVFRSIPSPGGAVLAVAVWSPADNSVVETARIPHGALLTRRGDVAVVAVGPREKAILDLATGREQRVAGDAPDTLPRALVLGDGHVALTMGGEVRITDAGGATLAVVPLPPKSQAAALRETEPGRLAVGVWSVVLSQKGTLFVDAATGAILREDPGLMPAGLQSGPWPQPAPGSMAARLFTDDEGRLVSLEPGDQRRVVIAGAGS